MTAKHTGLLALAIMLGSMILVGWSATTSDGATAAKGNLRVIRKQEDAFRNYDFTAKRVSRNGVDWPVGFVYFDRAEIDKVKDKLHDAMRYSGSSQYARVDNGGGPEWDSDKGKKTRRCPNWVFGASAYHSRFYAPPQTDYMYNTAWGYYIIATAHIDHNECWPLDRWYGYSETAEARIAEFAQEAFGESRVFRDHRFFNNAEETRREGNHIWLNNGWATFVRVP